MEEFVSRFREGFIVLLTAIGFALLIGVFGELIGIFFTGFDITSQQVLLIGSLIGAGVLGYFVFITLVPPLFISSYAESILQYDRNKGEFLRSVYYSQYIG